MDLQALFAQYEASHQNKWNRFFHYLGIPTIIVSLVLIAKSPTAPEPWIVFGLGWVFQFIGHAIERTMPEFLRNPLFLVVGPLYFVHKIKKKF